MPCMFIGSTMHKTTQVLGFKFEGSFVKSFGYTTTKPHRRYSEHMRPIATDDSVAWCVSLSRVCAVQKQLNLHGIET